MQNNNVTQQQKYVIMADEWFENAKNALGYAKTGLPDTEFYSLLPDPKSEMPRETLNVNREPLIGGGLAAAGA